MSDPEVKRYAKRVVPAPIASDPRLSSTILDVVCGEHEEVQWHWTMTDRGRVVSGYSIIRRTGSADALDTGADVNPSPDDDARHRPIGFTADFASKR